MAVARTFVSTAERLAYSVTGFDLGNTFASLDTDVTYEAIRTGSGPSVWKTETPSSADRVSVVTYGAVGDGVTDDTDAVQEAFTFALVMGLAAYFPKPSVSYLIGNNVRIRGALRIFGDGDGVSLIQMGPYWANPNPDIAAPFSLMSDTYEAKYNEGGGAFALAYLVAHPEARVHDVEFFGIRITGNGYNVDELIKPVAITSCGADRVRIHDCSFYSMAGENLWPGAGPSVNNYWEVDSNYFYNEDVLQTRSPGCAVQGNFYSSTAHHNTIVNCYIGVGLSGQDSVAHDNVIINALQGAVAFGDFTGDGVRCSALDNQIYLTTHEAGSPEAYGIYLTPSSRDCRIAGNTIRVKNLLITDQHFSRGIYATAIGTHVIENNVIVLDMNSIARTMTAIDVRLNEAGTAYYQIRGNTIRCENESTAGARTAVSTFAAVDGAVIISDQFDNKTIGFTDTNTGGDGYSLTNFYNTATTGTVTVNVRNHSSTGGKIRIQNAAQQLNFASADYVANAPFSFSTIGGPDGLRMTTAQIALLTPVKGWQVFDDTTGKARIYGGDAAWHDLW